MKLSHTKFDVSFSTLKPFLLMFLFALCIFNAGIVRADENSGRYIGEAIGQPQYDLDNRNIAEEFSADQFRVNSITVV